MAGKWNLRRDGKKLKNHVESVHPRTQVGRYGFDRCTAVTHNNMIIRYIFLRFEI